MNITFEFATQDDCLDKMVPSDLRKLVSERDYFKNGMAELQDIIDKMQPERYALAAQVEVLRRDNLSLLEYAADAERWFNLHDPNGYISPKRESAKACLAQLKADAGRAGWMACARVYCTDEHFMPHPLTGMTVIKGADQYANRIRQGVD